jgi:hypothetical protein
MCMCGVVSEKVELQQGINKAEAFAAEGPRTIIRR